MHGPQEVIPGVQIFDPDPIACLVEWSNEAPIIVDEQKVIMLINLGAQVSIVSCGFCEWMTLKVHPVDRLMQIKCV